MKRRTIEDIYLELDINIQNLDNKTVDLIGSYIVGSTIATDDAATFYSDYPMLEDISELGSDLELLGMELNGITAEQEPELFRY